jgi:hypothetical protein
MFESATFMAVISNPATWIVVAAAEELIALSPLKSNSVLQLVLRGLRSLRRGK